MSDVLGTILILALTVTLFSSIFFFVSTFPKPANQPASQFQGQLYYSYATKGTRSWTNVSSLTVTHLGGPTLHNFNTAIYVVSQAHPQNTTVVYSLTSGGLGTSSSTTWVTGQVFNLSLEGDHLVIPDNITVTFVSAGGVVYRQTLPGTNPTIPPIFDNEGTIPGSPVVNSSFTLFVQISDPFLRTTSTKVLLNTTTPGLSCTNPLSAYSSNTTSDLRMTYNSSSGLWIVPKCTATASGTYYVGVWVTDSNPIQVQSSSVIFPLTIGGGGCSNTYTATTAYSPSSVSFGTKVTIYLNVTNSNACDWIYISGSWTASTGTPTSGTFSNQIVPVGGMLTVKVTWTAPTSGSAGTATITFTLSSPSGATGPTTETLKISY